MDPSHCMFFCLACSTDEPGYRILFLVWLDMILAFSAHVRRVWKWSYGNCDSTMHWN